MERFIACKSRANNKHESHYPAHKGELQALVFACKKFEHLLSYRPFILRTDSTYLKQLETAKDLSSIFYRWLNYLSRFEIMVEYTKGSNNPADGLSRVCWPMGLGDDRESLGGDGLEQTVNQLGSGSYLKPRKDLILGQLLDTNIQRIKSILNKQASIKSVREQEVHKINTSAF